MGIKVFQRFVNLKVTGQFYEQGRLKFWPCECKCGNARGVEQKRLLSGKITSCVACEVKRKMERAVLFRES